MNAHFTDEKSEFKVLSQLLKKVQPSSLRTGMEQQRRLTNGWQDSRQGVFNPACKLGKALGASRGGLNFKVR